jgi:tetratricopeptide (TPR) repeat protein
MAHSLSDRAYALQLEGDILWHLESGNASEKYKQAAFLYQKEKRWIDAIAIYEHLLTQDPDSYEILAALLVFYATVDWREKFEDRYQCLLQLFYNRVVDELQIENAVKDLVIAVQMFEEEAQKTWFLQWFPRPLMSCRRLLRFVCGGFCKIVGHRLTVNTYTFPNSACVLPHTNLFKPHTNLFKKIPSHGCSVEI